MRCSCGGHLKAKHVSKGVDISPIVGLDRVVVQGDLTVCDKCSRPALDGEVIEAITEALARAMLQHNFPMRGNVVRFLRKYMQLTQAELADQVSVDRVTVARWETGTAPIGGPEALAVRTVVAAHLARQRPATVLHAAQDLFASVGRHDKKPPSSIKLARGARYEPVEGPPASVPPG